MPRPPADQEIAAPDAGSAGVHATPTKAKLALAFRFAIANAIASLSSKSRNQRQVCCGRRLAAA